MRRSRKDSFSTLFLSEITFNIGTVYHHKVKEPNKALMMSYHTSLFTVRDGINTTIGQIVNLHNVHIYYAWCKKYVVFYLPIIIHI